MKKIMPNYLNSTLYVEEIPFGSAVTAFEQFAEKKWSLLLDSAHYDENSGRYSYIAVDPFISLQAKNGKVFLDDIEQQDNPLSILQNLLRYYSQPYFSELPPFQGGAAGAFSYDLFQYIEKISTHNQDEINFPDLALGFFDVIAAYDHLKKQAWIISTGLPETESALRAKRAKERGQWLSQLIQQKKEKPTICHPICLDEDIISNFSADNYMAAVNRVKEYILAGDIFEANISQCFNANLPDQISSFQLFCRLRDFNPAPFSAYANLGDTFVVSASPERFLKLTEKKVETKPIKGTRPRSKNSEEDERYANELKASSKDHAENIMIVDLLRNDLSKVCENHSVVVKKLCELESFATVHHLVSSIEGKLRKEADAVDLLRAAFPGGSITGAPKIRAMQIIAEIESNQRGIYCGSIGYIGFNGCMDTSIAIRTFTVNQNGKIYFQAGGAITADSDPMEEYQETLTKAYALRCALTEA